jgi:hypothetical protein
VQFLHERVSVYARESQVDQGEIDIRVRLDHCVRFRCAPCLEDKRIRIQRPQDVTQTIPNERVVVDDEKLHLRHRLDRVPLKADMPH